MISGDASDGWLSWLKVDGSLLGELYTEAGNGVLISELGECDEVPEKATLHVTPTLHATPTLSVSDARASDQSIGLTRGQ